MATSPRSRTRGSSEMVSPVNGNRLLTGAHPKNTGGKKGRSGRRPKSFTAFMRSLREHPDVQQAILDAARDPMSKGFAAVLRQMAEYDDEKPAERQEIVGPVEVRVRFVDEAKRTTAS